MHYVDLADNCKLVPYQAPVGIEKNQVEACLQLADTVFLLLRDGGATDPDATLPGASGSLAHLLTVRVGECCVLAGPLELTQTMPSLPRDLPYDAFVRCAHGHFLNDCEQNMAHVMVRLKSKRVGDQALLDKENVRLSVVDYYRFMHLLQARCRQPDGDLNALAHRVLAAAEVLSNLLGGISILHRSVVQTHLGYALWLQKLEACR